MIFRKRGVISVAILDAFSCFFYSALLCSPRESVQRPPTAQPRIINLITRFSDNDPFRLFPDFSPDIVRDKKGAEKTDLAEVRRIDK